MSDERAYAQALTCVASGETRENTTEILRELYPWFSQDRLDRDMSEAFRDALRQGIDRDDIDPSWFLPA